MALTTAELAEIERVATKDEVDSRIGCHPGVPKPVADYMIDCHAPNREPVVSFFERPEDCEAGNTCVLDVWDRDSFREAYRFARIWCVGGLGRRVLQ